MKNFKYKLDLLFVVCLLVLACEGTQKQEKELTNSQRVLESTDKVKFDKFIEENPELSVHIEINPDYNEKEQLYHLGIEALDWDKPYPFIKLLKQLKTIGLKHLEVITFSKFAPLKFPNINAYLPSVKTLTLAECSFNQKIIIQECPLERLFIRGGGFSFIEFTQDINLEVLNIGNNLNFRTLPLGLNHLKNLRSLGLAVTNISSLDLDEIKKLPSLRDLGLEGTNISSLDLDEIKKLPSLEVLRVHASLIEKNSTLLKKISDMGIEVRSRAQ